MTAGAAATTGVAARSGRGFQITAGRESATAASISDRRMTEAFLESWLHICCNAAQAECVKPRMPMVPAAADDPASRGLFAARAKARTGAHGRTDGNRI